MKKYEYPFKCRVCGAWLYAMRLKMVRLCSRCLREERFVEEGENEDVDSAVC